jgi:dTDP-4-amino-4,6-dideoxygalactose transaminase
MPDKKIPLGRPYLDKESILNEIEKVIDTRWISGGPTIAKFEEAVKTFNNDPEGHYIAVSDGTCAIEMSLLALNNGHRYSKTDEVIIPSWSWVASGFAPIMAGASPVWCDVNVYGVPTVQTIEPRITKNTKAIIIVHQMGVPCDIDAIQELASKYNLPIIEDAACAIGSEYKGKKIGTSGNLVTYSFQARKCVTTGEGGMIVTKDAKLAEWLRSYRAFGTTISPLERDKAAFLLKESFDKISGNYKISDITAAVGIAQLGVFPKEISMRDSAGKYYDSLVLSKLGEYACPANLIPEYCTAYNWQNYHIMLSPKFNRDIVVDLLRKQGIGCKWDIQAIHIEPVFGKKYEDMSWGLPNTMNFHNYGLWLPFYAEITQEDQDYVIETLKNTLDGLSSTK